MTIRKSVNMVRDKGLKQSDAWRFSWPNAADFNFNYYRLLELAEKQGIGKNSNPDLKIAIVGAGTAGLTAARELFRCGYTNIDIYEASKRIGGRAYSIPALGQKTTFELGAMRMPLFTEPGSKNSVLEYYRHLYNIQTQPFLNPGCDHLPRTGIYVNNGYGTNLQNPLKRPTLIEWKGGQAPPSKEFEAVYKKWDHFASVLKSICQEKYNDSENWPTFWQKIVNHWLMWLVV